MTDETPASEQATPHGPTEEEIRLRAHEISLRADAGTPEENWIRAELELVDAMRAERETEGAKRHEELEQARDEEAAALGHAQWFSQGHP